jgi:hypothetical protein
VEVVESILPTVKHIIFGIYREPAVRRECPFELWKSCDQRSRSPEGFRAFLGHLRPRKCHFTQQSETRVLAPMCSSSQLSRSYNEFNGLDKDKSKSGILPPSRDI